MRKWDSGSVWERAKLPSREGRTRGKARGAALGAAGGIVWGTGQLWAQRLEKGLDKELWGLSRDLLQPAGSPWGADPQGSPTAAGVYRAPKGAVLCAQDSQRSKVSGERAVRNCCRLSTVPAWAGGTASPHLCFLQPFLIPIAIRERINSHRKSPAHKQVQITVIQITNSCEAKPPFAGKYGEGNCDRHHLRSNLHLINFKRPKTFEGRLDL